MKRGFSIEANLGLCECDMLPLDADKIMSGNLGLVAIWVTQPLWPRRVPRSFNDSLFIFGFLLKMCRIRADYGSTVQLVRQTTGEEMAEESATIIVNNRWCMEIDS